MTKIFSDNIEQNPSPLGERGQEWAKAHRSQTGKIMDVFFQLLPSNYISQTIGPHYTLRFQAAAEQIASIQLSAQEIFYDSGFDYTRPEFLYQILGSLVFPNRNKPIPQIDGDLTYRDFLKTMVILLLRGSGKEEVLEGLELIVDNAIEILEKSTLSRDTQNSAWGLKDQFTYEVNVEEFPSDFTETQKNAALVIEALHPGHLLYQYRYLFQETFGGFTDSVQAFTITIRQYEDLRKYFLGAKEITGTSGETLTDRSLFNDPHRNFGYVAPGAYLNILSGANEGRYEVDQVLSFPVGDDPTPRAYITQGTAPGFVALSGKATVVDGWIVDTSQDFANVLPTDVFIFTEGPNKGSYKLVTLSGNNGGSVGEALGPSTSAKPALCFLRIRERMPSALTSQSYTVDVDRMGFLSPHVVSHEDVSIYFVE